MKRCSACKHTKPFNEFHKNGSTKDFFNNLCESCHSEFVDSIGIVASAAASAGVTSEELGACMIYISKNQK